MSRAAVVFVAASLLLAHVAALRHETSVTHVRNAATGLVTHAHALIERHVETAASDIHGRAADGVADLEDCAIVAGLEQATIVPTLPVTGIALAPVSPIPVAHVATAPPAKTPILLLAPKTSPPALFLRIASGDTALPA